MSIQIQYNGKAEIFENGQIELNDPVSKPLKLKLGPSVDDSFLDGSMFTPNEKEELCEVADYVDEISTEILLKEYIFLEASKLDSCEEEFFVTTEHDERKKKISALKKQLPLFQKIFEKGVECIENEERIEELEKEVARFEKVEAGIYAISVVVLSVAATVLLGSFISVQ